jgi:hypothetical protein
LRKGGEFIEMMMGETGRGKGQVDGNGGGGMVGQAEKGEKAAIRPHDT